MTESALPALTSSLSLVIKSGPSKTGQADERSVFRREMLTALGYCFRHGVLGFKLRDPFIWTLAAAGDPKYAGQFVGLSVVFFTLR